MSAVVVREVGRKRGIKVFWNIGPNYIIRSILMSNETILTAHMAHTHFLTDVELSFSTDAGNLFCQKSQSSHFIQIFKIISYSQGLSDFIERCKMIFAFERYSSNSVISLNISTNTAS